MAESPIRYSGMEFGLEISTNTGEVQLIIFGVYRYGGESPHQYQHYSSLTILS